MKTIELSAINKKIQTEPEAFVQETNAAYLEQLNRIAADIAENREQKPIILLSGPSGSGKTTTALMLEKILDDRGVSTHTLSLDNYFSPFTEEQMQLYQAGLLDLESPQRVDKAYLTEQLEAIYDCKPVELPLYDFMDSTRKSSGRILNRKPDELVILEGIHSLNPDILDFPDANTAKLYVSVRTRISHNGELLHPSKIRLMRRLVRDLLFRKRSFTDTIGMFASVEAGENKYIMPFKHRSDYDIDTFIAYEICAYRRFLDDALRQMPQDIIQDASRFLHHSTDLNPQIIPPDSLITEFCGEPPQVSGEPPQASCGEPPQVSCSEPLQVN